jgi:hypothetical protein
MRGQDRGDGAEHDRKRNQAGDIVLLVRLQQYVAGIFGVDIDADAGADRVARGLSQREHAGHQRRSARHDPVALELFSAGVIAIVDDGAGIVLIVRHMRVRLIHFGDGDDAFHHGPVRRRAHLASHPEEIEELAGENQQAHAGGNFGPEQMLSVEHGGSLKGSGLEMALV